MTLSSFCRFVGSFLALSAALALGRSATAREASPHDDVSREDAGTRTREPYPWSAAARAMIVPTVGIGGLGVGLDASYSLIPNLAVGAQHVVFVADQGADPQYCERCIRSGSSTFAFAEARYWPEGWATPYARLGLGWSHLRGQRVEYEEGYTEDDLSLLGEVGLDLHYRWVSLRLFAFDHVITGSALDKDAFIGGGVQLGARF